jgi:hypothetical protein
VHKFFSHTLLRDHLLVPRRHLLPLLCHLLLHLPRQHVMLSSKLLFSGYMFSMLQQGRPRVVSVTHFARTPVITAHCPCEVQDRAIGLFTILVLVKGHVINCKLIISTHVTAIIIH